MEDLVKELASELLKNNFTIGTAESCTAGLISAAIASRSGASKYHRGGFVTYATDLKEKLLDVGFIATVAIPYLKRWNGFIVEDRCLND